MDERTKQKLTKRIASGLKGMESMLDVEIGFLFEMFRRRTAVSFEELGIAQYCEVPSEYRGLWNEYKRMTDKARSDDLIPRRNYS